MKTRLAVAVALFALAAGMASAQAPTSFADGCQPDAKAPRVQLTGTVADVGGGAILGAAVSLQCGSFRADARTVGGGAFEISAPAGKYFVQVDAPGFESWGEELTLTAPGPQQREFKLAVGSYSSIVTVTESGGFVAASSTTSTKTDAPLIEIPQTVSVITLDQMNARNVQTVNEAIQYTGSVGVDTYGSESRFDWINIRGFDQSTYGLFRDNSRWQSGQVSGQIDPYLIQEIDVVKGPSSVLYGQNTPGGLVNLVTKRPPSTPHHEVVLNYGTENRLQGQLDLGGPLGDSGHLKYRLTALYRDSDTQVDYVPDNRWLIAPALTWSPTASTTLTVLADYQSDETGWGQFLPSQGTFVHNPNGKIDRGFFTGEPNYDYFDRDQWSVGTLFEHRVNSTWTVRNTMRYSSIEFDGKTAFGGGLAADLRTLSRFGYRNTLDLQIFTMDTNASARAVTGSVEHSFLFGIDYSTSTSKQVQGFSFAPSIDVFAPVYGAAIPDLFYYYDQKQPTSLLGFYAQDHMKIGKRWVATLSGRQDWTKLTTEDNLAGTEVKQDPSAFSGRAGVTYLSDVGLAPYVSYSTSFLPTGGSDFNGKPFDPTKGAQIEGGLKFQPKGSNSFLTASWFQITQTNVLTPDPVNPFSSVQQGEIRSRGWELEAVGQAAQGLSYHLSYSKLDQEVTKTTDPTALGRRPALAPDQLFGASGDYTVTSGPLTGFGFGLGIRYVGTRAGDSTNSIEVPSYTLGDLFVRYLWRDMEFLVSATNVTDKTYVGVCTSASYCNYGSARKVIGTVRYTWK